jgi:hypothetical protein
MNLDFRSNQENWQQAQLPNNTKSSRIVSNIYEATSLNQYWFTQDMEQRIHKHTSSSSYVHLTNSNSTLTKV